MDIVESQEEITLQDLYNVCEYDQSDRLLWIIQCLLAEGIEISEADTATGWTAFHLLCKNNQTEHLVAILKLFIREGVDINETTKKRWNALHLLCRYNQTQYLIQAVDLLLAHGVHVTGQTLNGWTPLDLLCRYNTTPYAFHVASLLLTNEVSVYGRNCSGSAGALHIACQYNQSEHLIHLVRLFLSDGFDVEARDSAGLRAFDLLCRHNQTDQLIDIVKLFIDKGVDINAQTPILKKTALHILCRYNQSRALYRIIHLLMKNGLNVRSKDLSGTTAFETLCQFNQTNSLFDIIGLFCRYDQGILESRTGYQSLHLLCKYRQREDLYDILGGYYLSSCLINATNKYGSTALHILCQYHQSRQLLKIIKLLCRELHDVNAKGGKGRTLLHTLCHSNQTGTLEEIICYLISKGIDVNAKDSKGWTALHFLCRYNQSDQLASIIRLLLNAEAEFESKNVHGWNVMHFLCRYNQTDQLPRAVSYLLRRGLGVNEIISDGSTALHLLCRWNQSDHLVSTIAGMITHGLNVRAIRQDGSTALHLLCRFNRRESVKKVMAMLIRNGLDVNAQRRDGSTALHILCQYHRKSLLLWILNLFMRNHINVNIRTNDGSTALHMLCLHNRCAPLVDAFFLLCSSKVDLNIRNRSGRVPVECCLLNSKGHFHEILNQLMDQRLDVMVDYRSVIDMAKLGCVEMVDYYCEMFDIRMRDHHGRDAFDYLSEIWDKSFSLCPICCKRTWDRPAVEQRLRSKYRKVIETKRSVFRKRALESSIPNMDHSFLCNRADFPINVPADGCWRDALAQWHSNQLDLKTVLGYMASAEHDNCDDLACRWCCVFNDVIRYVNSVIKQVEELDSRFKLKTLIEYGSWAERTKIFSPDEFDFAYVLQRFHQWESHSDLVVYDGAEREIDCFIDQQTGTISSGRLIYYFYKLMKEASDCVYDVHCFSPQVRLSETCATLRFTYRGRQPPHFEISVDITPAVCLKNCDQRIKNLPEWCQLTRPNEYEQYLVPYRSHQAYGRWRLSYPSLERDTLLSAHKSIRGVFRMIKFLVALFNYDASCDEIPRKLVPSSYAIKTCLLNYLNKLQPNHVIWKTEDYAAHCIGILREFDNARCELKSFFDGAASVYSMNGHAENNVRKIIDKLGIMQRISGWEEIEGEMVKISDEFD